MRARTAWIAFALVSAGALALLLWRVGAQRGAQPSAGQSASAARGAGQEAAYVGSKACGGCHVAESEAWRGSQHSVAMQVADERTVIGDFADATFEHFGVTSTFFRRDGKFMVRTDGPDGKLADFEVRHTFGVYPLQQYLIELGGGHVQALSIAWDARPKSAGGQRWFHLYPSERVPHTDELHWTQRQQNWNYMCADCHATDLDKNYDAATGTYATRWSELSVGCEACHGPGSAHVAWAEAAHSGARPAGDDGLTVHFDERRTAAWRIDPATGSALRSSPRASDVEIDVCAQCHSRRGQFSSDYRAGAKLLDHYLPAALTTGLYHPDGQQREEVYNWGSFLSSRMYAKGVTCGDCHEPHAGKLRAEGNAVCAQCHLASKYDAPTHHFHKAGTLGAACVSCHMATEAYMVVDPRHDHSFRIPRPDLAATLGVPDACSRCHGERGAAWAASEIAARYPQRKPGFQDFAAAFAAADGGEATASIGLAQVVANRDQSAIARASALERLAGLGGDNAVLAAEAGLDDPSPLVRHAAIAAYDALPPEQRRAVLPLLADPSRSVRMRAARTLAPMPDQALGAANTAAYVRAAEEYVAAERFNADRPENRTNLGGFFADRGRFMEAEAEFRGALALDSRFVPAWVNLADLMRVRDREGDAEAVLREGLAQAPNDAMLHHVLGLSLVRQGRREEALRELERATRLAPDEERFAYVYSVARDEFRTPAAAPR